MAISPATKGLSGPFGSSSIGIALRGLYQARMSPTGLAQLEAWLGSRTQVNRARIMEELLWRASRLTPENGYDVAIHTVDAVMRTYHQMGRENMPAVCLFPASNQPPPQYDVAGHRTEFLDVSAILHVSGDSDADRRLQLALLEDAFFEEINKDPERGGWAFDTMRTTGSQTDEGVPEADGDDDGTATMVTGFRVSFIPGTHGDKPMRHSDAYISTSAPTTVGVAGTFTRALGTWAQGVTPRGFTVGADGSLTYIRERALPFRAAASLSVTGASAGIVSARLNVGGVGLDRTRVDATLDAGETATLNLEALVDLAQDQAAFVEITHQSATGALTASRGTFTLSTMPLV
tara:strand:- start:4766 stop:5809 length:1044 start_codon:yes stop_codon:yes gene_type:complete